MHGNIPEFVRDLFADAPLAGAADPGGPKGGVCAKASARPGTDLVRERALCCLRSTLWDRSLTSRFGGGRIATCPSVQAFQG